CSFSCGLCPLPASMCRFSVAGGCAAHFPVASVPFQDVCVISLLLVAVLLIFLWPLSPSSEYVSFLCCWWLCCSFSCGLCPLPGCMCHFSVAGGCAAHFPVASVPFQRVCVVSLLLVAVLLIFLWPLSPSRMYVSFLCCWWLCCSFSCGLCPLPASMCRFSVAGGCAAHFPVASVPFQVVCVISLLLVAVLLIFLWPLSPSSEYVSFLCCWWLCCSFSCGLCPLPGCMCH